MYTLGAGSILIKSIIIEFLLNLMAWKASWAHRTGENEKKKDDKIKKSRSKRRAPVVLLVLLQSRSILMSFSQQVVSAYYLVRSFYVIKLVLKIIIC